MAELRFALRLSVAQNIGVGVPGERPPQKIEAEARILSGDDARWRTGKIGPVLALDLAGGRAYLDAADLRGILARMEGMEA